MPHSDDLLEWIDELPTLEAIHYCAGRPGCEYVLCETERLFEAQQMGWRTINKAPSFLLRGPGGECSFMLLERGIPAEGISPQASRQPLEVSTSLLVKTGLTHLGRGLEEMLTAPPSEPKPKRGPIASAGAAA